MVSKIEFSGSTFIVPIDHINYMCQLLNGNVFVALINGQMLSFNDETGFDTDNKIRNRIFRELVDDLDLYKGLER